MSFVASCTKELKPVIVDRTLPVEAHLVYKLLLPKLLSTPNSRIDTCRQDDHGFHLPLNIKLHTLSASPPHCKILSVVGNLSIFTLHNSNPILGNVVAQMHLKILLFVS